MNALRGLLIPLSPLYGAVVTAKRRLYGRGWLKQSRLSPPVISVGSVSAGGAGKTPVVAMLAEILYRRGYAVDILTRGYGRISNVAGRVEPYDDPLWHGDEPVLLARKTGVPIFTGAERYRAGLLAEQARDSARTGVHLLDDGFQHLRLARDIDIVLLTVEDVQDYLLPAGNLREPLSAVSEASVVVVREEEADQLKDILERLQPKERRFTIWQIRRRLSLPEGSELPTLPLAFCGIARPGNFIRMLKSARYEPLETVVFPDHHRYEEGDITRLLETARLRQTNGFVTTEKDAVKLTTEMCARLETAGPLVVAPLRAELIDERAVMEQLVRLAPALDRRKTDRS